MNLNAVTLAGRLTRDPELKVLDSGTNICNFSLATSYTYKPKDGTAVESTEYHNIVVFGKTADNVAKYLTKGQIALVEGRLQTRSWETDGVKHYRTEIIADRIQFGQKAGGGSKSDGVDEEPTINEEEIPF